MISDNFAIFIDANKYLDIYRMNTGKELLDILSKCGEYIFVTEQIVSEVQRNKVDVAARYLKDIYRKFECNISIPSWHLLEDGGVNGEEMRKEVRDQRQRLDALHKEVRRGIENAVSRIGRSEDSISVVLKSIFVRARKCGQEEYERARVRKELGNPPGKKGDPLGDQVSWEQLLVYVRGKKAVWIISNDEDYGCECQGSAVMNALLYSDILNASPGINVHYFKNTIDGIRHFEQEVDVKSASDIPEDEIEAISSEERELADQEDAAMCALELGNTLALTDALRAASYASVKPLVLPDFSQLMRGALSQARLEEIMKMTRPFDILADKYLAQIEQLNRRLSMMDGIKPPYGSAVINDVSRPADQSNTSVSTNETLAENSSDDPMGTDRDKDRGTG